MEDEVGIIRFVERNIKKDFYGYKRNIYRSMIKIKRGGEEWIVF